MLLRIIWASVNRRMSRTLYRFVMQTKADVRYWTISSCGSNWKNHIGRSHIIKPMLDTVHRARDAIAISLITAPIPKRGRVRVMYRFKQDSS
jgi:hypothetical protein